MRPRRPAGLAPLLFALTFAGCGGSGGPTADKPVTADPAVQSAEKGTPKRVPLQDKAKVGKAAEG